MSDNIKKVYIANKGLGFIANKNIAKHTVVLVDESIIPNVKDTKNINVNLMVIYLILTLPDTEKIKQFEKLQPHLYDKNFIDIDTVTAIRNCSNPKIKSFLQKRKIDTINLYLEKYKRNAFNLDNSRNDTIPGILLNGAMFNHSCDPNISFTYSGSKMYFFTNRNIKKGEELCISYIDVSMGHTGRILELENRYGFICECELCKNKLKLCSERIMELKSNKIIDIKKLKSQYH